MIVCSPVVANFEGSGREACSCLRATIVFCIGSDVASRFNVSTQRITVIEKSVIRGRATNCGYSVGSVDYNPMAMFRQACHRVEFALARITDGMYNLLLGMHVKYLDVV